MTFYFSGFFLLLSLMMPLISVSIHMIFMLFITSIFTLFWLAVNVNTPMACITFLIYISGLLVTFSYLASLTPNNKTMNVFLFLVLLLPLSLMKTKFKVMNSVSFEESLTTLISLENLSLFIFIVVLLLLMLVAVVNLVYNPKKSLRGSL